MPSLHWVLYEYQTCLPYRLIQFFCHFALLIFSIFFFLPTGKLKATKICIYPWKCKTNTKIPLQLIRPFFCFKNKMKKREIPHSLKFQFFNVRIVYTSRPIYLLLQICYFINLCVFVLAAKKMLSYMHYCCICVLPLNICSYVFLFSILFDFLNCGPCCCCSCCYSVHFKTFTHVNRSEQP